MYIKNVANQHNNYYISNKINTKSYATNNTNEVLGYKVDKEGYFTSEFNKAANIPTDIKIHSSTMQSLVDFWANENTSSMVKAFENIDIAKTIGNAYKIVSSLIQSSPHLSTKTSFSKDDIQNHFPHTYIINKDSLNVENTFSYEEVKDIVSNGGFKTLSNNQILAPSFFNADNTDENSKTLPTNPNILQSTDTALSWDTNADKYTNEDGSISMGGMIVGFLSKNAFAVPGLNLVEGESTAWGKLQGFDKNVNKDDIANFNEKLSSTFFANLADAFSLLNSTDDLKTLESKLNALSFKNENSKTFLDLLTELSKKNLTFIDLMTIDIKS
ncbi:Cj0814 family flagellar-dependent secreted protein [uncultured Campylobacter sp.]|uniref:Cj0814 family flagellar-dependent secreted protein n=1 Tax=uncultured Campylobacter sp. TaxID=218934 RepID=UPI0026371FE8|nr:hypothetical protein [uncultured Campylobacter sp.]